jgi:hypothetical protein
MMSPTVAAVLLPDRSGSARAAPGVAAQVVLWSTLARPSAPSPRFLIPALDHRQVLALLLQRGAEAVHQVRMALLMGQRHQGFNRSSGT